MFRQLLAFVIVAASAIAQTAGTPTVHSRYVISGAVVDAIRGGALHDIEVSIRPAESDTALRAVMTGDDGHFEFRDLPRGKYGLLAHGRGYLLQAFQEHGEYSTAIVTGEGLQSEGLAFPLKPESAISGTITDEFNEPVPRLQVMLFTTGVPGTEGAILPRGEVSTDDIGHYRFSHLPEGKYYVVAKGKPWYAKADEAQGAVAGSSISGGSGTTYYPSSLSAESQVPPNDLNVAYPTTYYPNASGPEQATPITLKPGDRAAADFHLFAVPALRLRIQGMPSDSNASYVSPFLQERIFGHSRQAGSSRVDANGTFEFTGLAPGQYVLRLPGEGHASWREMPVDLAGDLDIAPGKGAEALSPLSGTVQVENGAAISDGYIRLWNFRRGEGVGGPISNKGEFTVESGVRSGRYNLGILNEGGYVVKSISAIGAKVIGRQVEVSRGSTVRLSIIVTKGVGRIDGIALREGKPASQTAIFLVPDDPAHNMPLFRRDQSDSDGTFTLRQVVPGNYTLISVAEGWELEWTDPAVIEPYLAAGLKMRVEADRKYQMTAEVQPRQLSTMAPSK